MICGLTLTATTGEQPHGGNNCARLEVKAESEKSTKQILSTDLETATGLLEDCYCHLDLLQEDTAGMGGVTPVVTQPTAEAV
jgi:hypothetical protein